MKLISFRGWLGISPEVKPSIEAFLLISTSAMSNDRYKK